MACACFASQTRAVCSFVLRVIGRWSWDAFPWAFLDSLHSMYGIYACCIVHWGVEAVNVYAIHGVSGVVDDCSLLILLI